MLDSGSLLFQIQQNSIILEKWLCEKLVIIHIKGQGFIKNACLFDYFEISGICFFSGTF